MRYLVLLFLFLPQIIFAQVEKFVFTTDVQSIKTNTLSSPLTIQSQDSLGNPKPVSETFDIEFKSSSSGGLFLNSSENPVSSIMSKNTTNRTFYYKDLNEGLYTLSVTAKGRESGKVFEASQKITVSNGVIEESNQNNISSDKEVKNEEVKKIKIKSIKDKTVSVGNQVLFKADVSGDKYTRIVWNFGDGVVSEGSVVSHIYRFEGYYQVLVKAINSSDEDVYKFKVLVKKPTVSISSFPYGVLIENNSDGELFLDNWQLTNGLSYFNFPENSVISPETKIIFPKEVTGIYGDKVVLKDNLGQVVADFHLSDIKKIEISQEKIKEKEFSKPKEEIRSKEIKVTQIKTKNIEVSNKASTSPKENNKGASAKDVILYKAEVKKSFLDGFLNWFKVF